MFVVERFLGNVAGNITTNEIICNSRAFVFHDGEGGFLPPGNTTWSLAVLMQVRDVIIEFFTKYKNTRTGGKIMPSTLRTCIISLQRAL